MRNDAAYPVGAFAPARVVCPALRLSFSRSLLPVNCTIRV